MYNFFVDSEEPVDDMVVTPAKPRRVAEGRPRYPLGMSPDTQIDHNLNVESFNLDHRSVLAPYVRVADRLVLPGGDTLIKYDVRFTQPNVEHLPMDAIHSIEHMTAHHMRNHTDALIDFSPMGCQTGFYALTLGLEYEDFAGVLERTFTDLLAADSVPAANEIQCGWGANHSLEGAKREVAKFLAGRDEWHLVQGEPIEGDEGDGAHA